MGSRLCSGGDKGVFRLVALLVSAFVLSVGGVTWAYAASASPGNPASAGFEAQASPLYTESLKTTVEAFDVVPVSSRPQLASGSGLAGTPGIQPKITYEYTCMGSATCQGASTCVVTCVSSTCISTCGSSCGGATYSSTCSSTCKSTCSSTCSSTCKSTCSSTCSAVTCAYTCGAKCDDPTPPYGLNFQRLAGKDRYTTAVAISQVAYPNGATGVVIATGLKYPDALAGSSLSYFTGPILLVGTTMSQAVKDEIARLNPTRAVILGSTKVVSTAIENYLKAEVGSTTRIGGADRYATSALIARETAKAWGGVPNKLAIIATGENFPDALAASPLSARQGFPILLVSKTAVPSATRAMLTELGIDGTLILGSTSAISTTVENQLPDPYRLGGGNRYETMGRIVDFMWMNYGMGTEYISLATGSNFPDALVGGAVTGGWGGVMLLTPGDVLHSQAATRLKRSAASLRWIDVYGGKSVIYPSVVTAAFNALQ